PLIEISGAASVAGANGLQIETAHCTIRGLVINGFRELAGDGGDGIALFGGSGTGFNVIAGNYLGIDASGTSAVANRSGISLRSDHNIVGGTTPADRNVISGNLGRGVITVFGTDNAIEGNYIGTDATGSADLGNGESGVALFTSNNVVGGPG